MVPLNFLIEARVGESGNILHAVCAHPSCCYSLFPTPDRFSAVYPFLSMAAAAAAYPATMKAMCDVRHATHPFMHSSQVDSTFYASPIHETNADVALWCALQLHIGSSKQGSKYFLPLFSQFSLNFQCTYIYLYFSTRPRCIPSFQRQQPHIHQQWKLCSTFVRPLCHSLFHSFQQSWRHILRFSHSFILICSPTAHRFLWASKCFLSVFSLNLTSISNVHLYFPTVPLFPQAIILHPFSTD